MDFKGFDQLKTISQFPQLCIQNNFYGCFINGKGTKSGDYLQEYYYTLMGGSRIKLNTIRYDELYYAKNFGEIDDFKDVRVDELVILNNSNKVMDPSKIKYGTPYKISYPGNKNRLLICVQKDDFPNSKNLPNIFMIDIKHKDKAFIKSNDKRLYWIFWPVQTNQKIVETCYYNGLGTRGCSPASTCIESVRKYCDNDRNFMNGLCKSIFFDYHYILSEDVRFDKLKENQCEKWRNTRDGANIEPQFDESVCRCINLNYKLNQQALKLLNNHGIPPYCTDDKCIDMDNRKYYRLSVMKPDQCPSTQCTIENIVANKRAVSITQLCKTEEKTIEPEPEPLPDEDEDNNNEDNKDIKEPEKKTNNLNTWLLGGILVSIGIVAIILIAMSSSRGRRRRRI